MPGVRRRRPPLPGRMRAKEVREAKEAPELFKRDMASNVKIYTFLAQMLDFGNPVVEARSIFIRRLGLALEFELERSTIDLSKMMLTHPSLREQGKRWDIRDTRDASQR